MIIVIVIVVVIVVLVLASLALRRSDETSRRFDDAVTSLDADIPAFNRLVKESDVPAIILR